MDITVVYDKKTRKIVPFQLEKDGTVTVISSGAYEDDRLIVSRIDAKKIDFFDGYVTEDKRFGKAERVH